MKKICVNQDACIGCGACVAIDPEHFAFNDEGFSSVISNEHLDSEELMNAISSCPTTAISSEETCHNKNCECDHCECESCDCSNETKNSD